MRQADRSAASVYPLLVSSTSAAGALRLHRLVSRFNVLPALLTQTKVDVGMLESQNFPMMKKAKRSHDGVLPTPGELRLLRILWRIGEGAIEDILKAADENPAPNYKTVQTLLRIMERKGQVEHSRKGRAFVFRPLIGRNDVHRLSIRDMVKKYFTGSRTELLVELLHDEHIPLKELRELENLIRGRRKEQMKG